MSTYQLFIKLYTSTYREYGFYPREARMDGRRQKKEACSSLNF